MDNKEMAEIFLDIIAVAQMPKIVNGKIYLEHRRTITITDEIIEAMLYAQKELHCKTVEFGSYDCYEITMDGVGVDGCLVGEINSLNNLGIKTRGCCCGHGRKHGFIQVSSEFVDKMKNMNYKQLPVESNGNGEWCFKPKTLLPKDNGTIRDEGKECLYCGIGEKSMDTTDDDASAYIDDKNLRLDTIVDGQLYCCNIEINCCPICGREL